MPNFYEILGVSPDAGEKDVKIAYRKLSLIHHPDKNPTNKDESERKFKEIGEAYETLKDPQRREQYNHELRFGGGGGGMPFTHMDSMNEFNDINNIFNAFFGGGGMPGFHGMGGPDIRMFHHGHGNFHAQNIQRPPPPIEHCIEITLEQCFHGCSVPIEYEKWTIMNGAKVTEMKRVNIDIPPGIFEHEAMQIHGMGNEINDQLRGDLKINFRISMHPEFKRQGLDLIFVKRLTLKESLCGFSVDITHLSNKILSINNKTNPTVVKPGFKRVIPKLGMNRDGQSGNLIIDFEVEFPDTLTEGQVTALNNIL